MPGPHLRGHSPRCQDSHSRIEAVIVALGSTEADDGVDHGGRVHRGEAIDDGHNQRVHLTVVAVDEKAPKLAHVTAFTGKDAVSPAQSRDMATPQSPGPVLCP